MEQINFASLKRKRDLHIILPVFLVSIIACIDRVNIAYAALTMTEDLPWLTPEIFGAGAGIFFKEMIACFLFRYFSPSSV